MISQFGMVPLMEQVKHDRPGAKIEGHALTDGQRGMTCQGSPQPPFLDAGHADRGPWQCPPLNLCIRPKKPIRQDRGKPVHMQDVVDLGLGGNGHVRYIATGERKHTFRP